jgi:hypothetical protein
MSIRERLKGVERRILAFLPPARDPFVTLRVPGSNDPRPDLTAEMAKRLGRLHIPDTDERYLDDGGPPDGESEVAA